MRTSAAPIPILRIDEIGSYIDEKLVGEAKIDEFGLGNEDYFTLQIGVEPNGTHIGHACP